MAGRVSPRTAKYRLETLGPVTTLPVGGFAEPQVPLEQLPAQQADKSSQLPPLGTQATHLDEMQSWPSLQSDVLVQVLLFSSCEVPASVEGVLPQAATSASDAAAATARSDEWILLRGPSGIMLVGSAAPCKGPQSGDRAMGSRPRDLMGTPRRLSGCCGVRPPPLSPRPN